MVRIQGVVHSVATEGTSGSAQQRPDDERCQRSTCWYRRQSWLSRARYSSEIREPQGLWRVRRPRPAIRLQRLALAHDLPAGSADKRIAADNDDEVTVIAPFRISITPNSLPEPSHLAAAHHLFWPHVVVGSRAAVLSYGRHGRTTPTTGPDGALALHGSRASLTAC
jgi:hypothetical protein